jgi:hypothetical protein
LGSSAGFDRSLAVGYYLSGCAFLLGGIFFGNRGPFRVAGEERMVGVSRARGIRTVSAIEQKETLNLSGVIVVVGLILLVLGAAVDPQTQLI